MTLTEVAYARIRQDIVDGTFAPASPLRLDKLKARYGVGYSPLREALSRLHSERLVDAAPLRGFTVAPLSLAQMWDAIETRIMIESRALRLAIGKGGDAWETGIVSALHTLSLQARRLENGHPPTTADLQTLEERHHAFHRALIADCGSEWSADLSERLYVATERYRFPSLTAIKGHPHSRDVHQEHQALADAAIARDAVRAVAILEAHYRLTGEQIELSAQDASNILSASYPANAVLKGGQA